VSTTRKAKKIRARVVAPRNAVRPLDTLQSDTIAMAREAIERDVIAVGGWALTQGRVDKAVAICARYGSAYVELGGVTVR
jgi:hypothetical protein